MVVEHMNDLVKGSDTLDIFRPVSRRILKCAHCRQLLIMLLTLELEELYTFGL